MLNAQLLKLRPDGFTERTVLFQDMKAATPKGPYYPFEVTAVIHDYGPGYPSNHYYGQTCVRRMDGWKFDMLKDDFGKWIVQGRMTVSDSHCKNNPSEGVSAIPLSGLSGTPAPAGTPVVSAPTDAAASPLYVGEYACYGTGGKLLAGMGFHLKGGGSYDNLDGREGGSYEYSASDATLAFRGGFLDGHKGTHVNTRGFDLSQTIHCEPWRP